MDFKHFSHQHNLVFHQVPPNHEIQCSGCKNPGSGNIYACWQCSFFLHDQCFRATRSLKHHTHPNHPLTLFPYPTYPSGSFICNSCNLSGKGMSYACSDCEFDIHVHCAYNTLNTVYPPPFQNTTYPPQPVPAQNNVPQVYPPPPPPQLVPAQNIPQVYPPPPPVPAQSVPQVYPPQPVPVQNVAQPVPAQSVPQVYPPQTVPAQNVPPPYPPQPVPAQNVPHAYPPQPNPAQNVPPQGYPPADYPTPAQTIDSTVVHTTPSVPPAQPANTTGPQPTNPVQGNQTSPPQQTPPSMIKHFSHPHVLKAIEVDRKDGKICSGCECYLNGSAYLCTEAQCKFCLHKACFDSPIEVKHPSHLEHPLKLLTSPPYADGFTCNACLKDGKAFAYTCSACSYDLHVDCIQWPETVNRSDHKHPLKLYYSSAGGHQTTQDVTFMCSVCKNPVHEMAWMYYCRECEFGTHLECIATGLTGTSGGGSGAQTDDDALTETDLIRFAMLQLLLQTQGANASLGLI